MGVLGDLKGPLIGLVASIVVFVVYGLLDVLTALTEPGATLVATIAAAIPYVIGLVLVGLAGIGFAGWGLYRVASGAVEGNSRLLNNEYVVRLARYAERESDLARSLDLSDRLEPSEEEQTRRRLQQLKDDYAAGKLSQAEFEREVDRLLAESTLSETEVYGSGSRELSRERR